MRKLRPVLADVGGHLTAHFPRALTPVFATALKALDELLAARTEIRTLTASLDEQKALFKTLTNLAESVQKERDEAWADLARCYEVCAEAIGSEYRNVGVVEACASFVGTLTADLAAEREARGRAVMALVDIKANAHWKPSAWPADRARRVIADLEGDE